MSISICRLFPCKRADLTGANPTYNNLRSILNKVPLKVNHVDGDFCIKDQFTVWVSPTLLFQKIDIIHSVGDGVWWSKYEEPEIAALFCLSCMPFLSNVRRLSLVSCRIRRFLLLDLVINITAIISGCLCNQPSLVHHHCPWLLEIKCREVQCSP